ncbi:MAG: hypothetical protein WCH52_02130 [Bacteroidota bacterium]
MTIAVQINSTSSNNNFFGDFNYLHFSLVARRYKNFKIMFISDQPFDPCIFIEPNIELVTLSPQISNGILAKIWYTVKLQKILKKNKIDFFFSNSYFCNLKELSKQIIFINDDSFLKKKSMEKYILASSFIITPNEYIQTKLSERFPALINKLLFISPFINENVKPINYSQKQEVKNIFSDGVDYFLLYANNTTTANIIMALKAFSIFKKWQLSNMKLLIVTGEKQNKKLSKEIENYKFRSDVKFFPENNVDVLCSAAYASVFFPDGLKIDNKMLDVMKMNIPILLPEQDYHQSFFKESALYFLNNESSLSQKMILIYKDESTRSSLINSAQLITSAHNPNTAVEKIIDTIINPKV